MTAAAPPVDVALLGFGTVGRAVARQLSDGRHASLRLRAVCTRRSCESRTSSPWVAPDVVWTDRLDDALATGASVVVELMGGAEPGRSSIARALEAGRSVVTANKQALAEHGPELIALARARGCALRFEAAVGGVTPVVRGVQDVLAADRLVSAAGVINGTTTYVLTKMEREGVALEDAVADAQARGLAEADPSADLDGLDARAKLVILTAIGLGCYAPPASVVTESIRGIEALDLAHAASLGCTIRQVAQVVRVSNGRPGVVARVAPAFVGRTSWLARAEGARNVLVVRGEHSGDTVFVGEGAGGDATAVAVVSDLLAVAEARTVPRAWPAGGPAALADLVAGHYVRVSAPAGALAADPTSLLAGLDCRIDRVLAAGPHWAAVLAPCSQQALSDGLRRFVSASGTGYAAIRLPFFDVG